MTIGESPLAQRNAAAERSAHVTRGQTRTKMAENCHVCGGPWIKGKGGTSSYAARCLPPLAQVCSAACAASPIFSPENTTR